jgi:hypothetical protein
VLQSLHQAIAQFLQFTSDFDRQFRYRLNLRKRLAVYMVIPDLPQSWCTAAAEGFAKSEAGAISAGSQEVIACLDNFFVGDFDWAHSGLLV